MQPRIVACSQRFLTFTVWVSTILALRKNGTPSGPAAGSSEVSPTARDFSRPSAKPSRGRSFGEYRSGAYLSYVSTGTQPKHRPRPGSAGVASDKILAVVLAGAPRHRVTPTIAVGLVFDGNADATVGAIFVGLDNLLSR